MSDRQTSNEWEQLARAEHLLMTGRTDSAIAEIRRFLAHQPENADGHLFLFHCYLVQSKFTDAESALNQALRLRPDDDRSHYHAARLHYWRACNFPFLNGRHVRAGSKAIKQALALNPHNGDYHAMQSQFNLLYPDFDKAKKCLERGLQIDPQNIACLIQMVRLLWVREKKREAEPFLRRILEIDLEHSEAKNYMAELENLRGRYRPAGDLTVTNLTQDPSDLKSQELWREAKCGSYPAYGRVAWFRNWMLYRHPWLSVLVIEILIFCPLFLYIAFGKSEDWSEALKLGAILSCTFGLLLSLGTVILLGVVLKAYLAICSGNLTWKDDELRNAFTWKSLFARYAGHMLFTFVALLAVGVIYAIQKGR